MTVGGNSIGPFSVSGGVTASISGLTFENGKGAPNGGAVNNGVVYLGIPGQLPTCRAVSLWGYTGRVRGWQLVQIAGVWTWRQK
jgi:hypothetical protein